MVSFIPVILGSYPYPYFIKHIEFVKKYIRFCRLKT